MCSYAGKVLSFSSEPSTGDAAETGVVVESQRERTDKKMKSLVAELDKLRAQAGTRARARARTHARTHAHAHPPTHSLTHPTPSRSLAQVDTEREKYAKVSESLIAADR